MSQPYHDDDDDEFTDASSNDDVGYSDDDLHDALAFEADDSDEDPDYEGIDPSDLPIDPRLLGDPAGSLGTSLFPGDPDESENDEEEGAAVINDDEMSNFHQDLKAAQGFKKGMKRRPGSGRRAIGDETYSFEVNSLMGEANTAFAFGNLDKAMEAVKKVIQIEAGVYSAWKILGEIFKEKGEYHKCLLAWLTACHARPKDWELWSVCAKMSLEQFGDDRQNYRDQAIYCYNRTIRANPDNIDAIYDRSLLLKEQGHLKKAADGFMMLNRLLPYDMGVLKEIATLYMELGKVQDAISLYTTSIEYFKSTGNRDKAFGWSELNILTELYITAQRWEEAITAMKDLGRWLYGRSAEKFWDSQKDDREWDAGDQRKMKVGAYVPGRHPVETYMLPIELRVKLGICRLKMGQHDEAMVHFNYLSELDANEYADLYSEVGNVLLSTKDYEDAIHFFFAVAETAEYLDRQLWFSLATCYKALNRVDDAEECYITVLEGCPDDTDAMMQLAAIYEVSDRKPEALDLVTNVLRIRKDKETAQKLAAEHAQNFVATDRLMAFLPNKTSKKPTKKAPTKTKRLSPQQQAEMNEKRTEQSMLKFQKLEYMRAAMEDGEPDAVKEYLDTAGDLVDDFRNTRAFYPAERGKEFKGFLTTAERRENAQGINERIEKIQHRLQESLAFEEVPIENAQELTTFRGLDFDTWLYIFIQYAICLTKHDSNPLDAYDVCSAAKEANVFYRSRRHIFTIYTTWLSCAIFARDTESVSSIGRWFLTNYQFVPETYNLVTASITASQTGTEIFHSNPNQKYLLRQIKTMDEALDGVKRVGAANLTNLDEEGNEFVPETIDVALLMLYGHMLTAGRSYMSALNYYTRVYAVAPESPIVLFSIALAYLHRSMQRQSENRHVQVLQGLTFLTEYYERRKQTEPEEAEYNRARALHALGLSHLAIEGYRKVLEMEGGDLKAEAAWNLQLILFTSGNVVEARELGRRWLVIE